MVGQGVEVGLKKDSVCFASVQMILIHKAAFQEADTVLLSFSGNSVTTSVSYCCG